MISLKFMSLFLSFACLTTACGEKSSDGDLGNPKPEQKPIKKDEPEPIFLIHGQAPIKFYSQFFFKDSESCEPNRKMFGKTMSEKIYLGKDDQGRALLAGIDLLILPDGAYHLIYEETTVERSLGLSYAGFISAKKVIRGKWTIEKTSIVFSGLGVGQGLVYNGRGAISIYIDRNFATPGLIGQSAAVFRSWGDHVPVTGISVCP